MTMSTSSYSIGHDCKELICITQQFHKNIYIKHDKGNTTQIIIIVKKAKTNTAVGLTKTRGFFLNIFILIITIIHLHQRV